MKSVILNSGGIDSTTCVGMAVDKYGKDNVTTVSIYYGQTLSKELDCANNIAKHYGVNHEVLDLTEIFKKNSTCSLIKNSGVEIKRDSYQEQTKNGEILTSYVPFRNGLMLSAVASLALSIYPDDDIEVYLGCHEDDALYADCTPEFIEKMSEAIAQGTYNKVHLITPLMKLTKSGVVKEGLRLKVPYELTWSCYEGGDEACGTCASCIDRRNAFILNGTTDPIKYRV